MVTDGDLGAARKWPAFAHNRQLNVDFFLFLVVNATLFIRPGELIPALATLPIYNIVIVSNLLIAAPAIVNELSQRNLARSPMTVCVLGIFTFVVLSHVARFDMGSAYANGFEFAKVVAYFLLFVGTITTPRRLGILLAAVAGFTVVVNLLAVLQHHGKIDLPALSVVMEMSRNELTGEALEIPRLRTTGIFQDPNDLSMIIVVSILILGSGLFYQALGGMRWLLACPILFLGYALSLTQSRGGLLALLAGCGWFFYARFGLARASLLAAACIPVLLAGFAGRQANFSEALSGGTGKTRIELWSDGMELLKASPVFGIGANRYIEEVGKVAHNSFVDAFVELGFFGGTLFLGLFATVGWSLWKMRGVQHEIEHPGLRHFLPYLIAILVAYSMSMMSLSRQYIVATYLVPGIAASYVRLAQPGTSMEPLHWNAEMVKKLAWFGLAFLAVVYGYIRFVHRAG